MANTKTTGLINGDLAFDLEKLRGYDKPKVKKDAYENEEVVFTIEVNDSSYMYLSKTDRDKDFAILKRYLAGKPFLQIKTVPFVEFMTDENGIGMLSVANKLIKKGSFTLEDLVASCEYIPSHIIRGKTKIPKELRNNEVIGEFEVSPNNFIVVLV